MDEAARQERKLNVWRRVKNALDRWAQLRRMTRYGLAWLAEAARTSTADNEKFEEKYGYSYEYVIIFPNETEDTGWKNNQLGFLFDTPDSMQRKKKGGPEEISKKDQINAAIKALKDCGIETKQYPSVQDDELLCLVRVPPHVLGLFCEMNKIELEIDAEKLEDIVVNGSPQHEIPPMPVPHDDEICEYKPYDHIFAPYNRRVHEYFKRGIGLKHPFDRLTRLRLTERIIQSDIEVDKTKQGGAGLKLNELMEKGIIVDHFAMHDEELRTSVYDNWVLKATWPWALPADLIRAYFGEKVALFFAFTAHYTSWLLPLALLGFVTQMQILQNGYDDAFLLFAFSACTSVWSIFMLESWKRKEWHHTVTWGMSNYATAESERPQFHGVLRPSLVDGEDVIYYPAWAKRRDFAWSSAVTLFLIVLNLVLQIFIFGFRSIVSQTEGDEEQKQLLVLLASLLTSMQISLADFVYQGVAVQLTDLENHRVDSEYYDALIGKFAIFQLTNNYSSLFYIAFIKPAMGIPCESLSGSMSNPCMEELGYLLGIVFISDMGASMVMQIVVPRIKARLRAWKEGVSLLRRKSDVRGLHDPSSSFFVGANGEDDSKGGDDGDIDGANPSARGPQGVDVAVSSIAEQEAVLEPYDIILDLLMDYKTVNIQFGYLTFFVAALPVLPVIAFAANVAEMRVDGHKLLKEHRCPALHGALSIGMWHSVFLCYGVLAVMSNSAIICFRTSILGDDISTTSKVWLFFIFQYIIFGTIVAVAVIIPDTPESCMTQLARQDHYNADVIDRLVSGGSDVLERFRDEAVKLSKQGGGYEKVFELLSIDGHTITSQSLKLGLNLIGFKTNDLDMKVLMNRIDDDKSGVLDINEFRAFCSSTTQNDVREICRRLRRRLGSVMDEVMMIFNKHDLDGNGTINGSELRRILKEDLDMEITEKEASTLITRFDIDDSGGISAQEFARFLKGEQAVDLGELKLKLQEKFLLCETNGMSVVKLFTAVDQKNSGLIPFSAVKAILRKYIALNLSTFEFNLIMRNYRGTLDEKFCRYTDMYSDAMTASVEVDGDVDDGALNPSSENDKADGNGGDEENDAGATGIGMGGIGTTSGGGVDARRRLVPPMRGSSGDNGFGGFGGGGGGGGEGAKQRGDDGMVLRGTGVHDMVDDDILDILGPEAAAFHEPSPRHGLSETPQSEQQHQRTHKSDINTRRLLRNLDWHTPAQMSVSLAKLAADYSYVGDFGNAEALYHHSIALANAVHERAERSDSLGLPRKLERASLTEVQDKAKGVWEEENNPRDLMSNHLGMESEVVADKKAMQAELYSFRHGAHASDLGSLGARLASLDEKLEAARRGLVASFENNKAHFLQASKGPNGTQRLAEDLAPLLTGESQRGSSSATTSKWTTPSSRPSVANHPGEWGSTTDGGGAAFIGPGRNAEEQTRLELDRLKKTTSQRKSNARWAGPASSDGAFSHSSMTTNPGSEESHYPGHTFSPLPTSSSSSSSSLRNDKKYGSVEESKGEVEGRHDSRSGGKRSPAPRRREGMHGGLFPTKPAVTRVREVSAEDVTMHAARKGKRRTSMHAANVGGGLRAAAMLGGREYRAATMGGALKRPMNDTARPSDAFSSSTDEDRRASSAGANESSRHVSQFAFSEDFDVQKRHITKIEVKNSPKTPASLLSRALSHRDAFDADGETIQRPAESIDRPAMAANSTDIFAGRLPANAAGGDWGDQDDDAEGFDI